MALEEASFDEASMNFDSEEVRPFLERLTARLFALQPCDIERLAREIIEVPVARVGRWHFDVVYDERSVPLEVRAAMEESAAPDVYFFTVPDLADRIQAEMRMFSDARTAPSAPPVVAPNLLWLLLVTGIN
jgi:hypothetical protein